MISAADSVAGVWGWMFGLGHLLTCLLLLSYLLRRLRVHALDRRVASAIEERTPELAPGLVTLRGTVRTESSGPAIELRIEQHGAEHRVKNGYRVTWTEIDRQRTEKPFSLELFGGEKVRVETRHDFVLADELEIQRTAPTERICVARLDHGESVAVTGVLSRETVFGGAGEGYRDGARGWVLRPPPGALLSTAHLAEAGVRWSRFFGIWSALVVLVCLGVQSLLFVTFYDVALAGVVSRAEVVELDTYVTRGRRGHRTTHYRVRAVLLDGDLEGTSLTEDVTRWSWESLDEGDEIPWLVVPGRSSHNEIGSEPAVPLALLFLTVVGSLLLGLGYWLHLRRTKTWWEQSKLVHELSGRL